jgi:hypothetical protein
MCEGDEKCTQNFSQKSDGRDYFRDIGIGERITLKWDPIVDTYEHGNVPYAFIEGKEFFGQLRDYQLLRKDSVA